MLKKKKKNFHARFSAKKRLYEYLIINRNASLSLDVNRAWHVKNNEEDSSEDISNKLSKISSDNIVTSLDEIFKKNAKFTEQEHEKATYAEKIS